MTEFSSAELSIILPAYKEKNNLATLIPQIEVEFRDISFEIIIVDDGSKDGTVELIADLSKKFNNIRLIERSGLLGIGSALREGYNAARGKFILSSDADLSFETKDMRSLYTKIGEGYDIVLGYKIGYNPLAYAKHPVKPLAVRIKHFISQLISKVGNWIVRIMSGFWSIGDFNTNFRILRRSKWLELKTVEDKNFFLFETILLGKKLDFKIMEIPVTFYDRKFGESKLNFLQEAPKYFWKLIRHTILP